MKLGRKVPKKLMKTEKGQDFKECTVPKHQ